MNTTWHLALASIFCVISMGVGCDSFKSDPREASDANFEKALNAYYQKNPICIMSSVKLPYTLEKDAWGISESSIKKLDALAEAGFLEMKEKTVEREEKGRLRIGGGDDKKMVEVDVVEYSLSDTGKEHRVEKKNILVGVRDNFCYAHWKVKEIIHFSEPGDAFGMSISDVKLVKQVEDVSDWAKEGKIAEFTNVEGSKETNETMVLTSKGWIHSNEM